MTRHRSLHFLLPLVLTVLSLTSVVVGQTSSKPSDKSNPPISARARAIHDSAIVVDTHADTPQRFLDEGFDIGSTDPNDVGHLSLDKARRGNLGAEFFSIWVDPETNHGHFAQHTFDLIDSVYEQAARHPDRMIMAFSVADIERAHQQHKLAALMGIEGGHSIENDMRLLRDYYRLGVRYMTLSWSIPMPTRRSVFWTKASISDPPTRMMWAMSAWTKPAAAILARNFFQYG